MNRKSYSRFGMVAMLVTMVCMLAATLFAQVTNAPPPFDPSTAPLPTDTSSYWEYGIALVSPVLVWLFAKCGPRVPVAVLPLLAPVVGMILGWVLNALGAAHLGWVDMAKAGALAVFIRELTNQLVTKPFINGETMKKTGALIILFLGLAVGLTGCASKLEPGGAYAPTAVAVQPDGSTVTNAVSAPDMELYATDAAFDFAHSAILSAMEFERDNRALLWHISPDIKHTLDKLRPQVVEVATAWAKARKAYIANPTPANLSVLQQSLAKIRAINAAVATAIPARK